MSTKTLFLNTEVKNLVSLNQAWHYRIIPSRIENNTLLLYSDSTNNLNELQIILGRKIELVNITTEDLEKLLNTHYQKSGVDVGNGSNQNGNYRLNINDDRFLESLIREAKDLRSSDIHIETYGEKCRVRMRVDGIMIDRHKINRNEYPTLINKIKIASACDIAEKRLPQDGRIRLQFSGNKLDIRVSILPTLYGEKIVLRLLGTDASHINIDNLGMNSEELDRYKLAVKKPNGIILISGPTGSGKTTTLYATLKLLNKPTTNILTIEDPIEYTLDGINQVQLKEEIGLNYAETLRSFLRQDPDIIMLGEIRDAQTAEMAIRAALTGHLVLSTIHTNSSWGTISRLIDMGVPPYLLSGTINLSVAQRLIRLLCTYCKKEEVLDNKLLPSGYSSNNIKTHFVSTGCPQCNYSGYKSRKAIYEVIDINSDLKEYIKANKTDILDYLKEKKILSLKDNAYAMFTNGVTSLDEVYPYLIS